MKKRLLRTMLMTSILATSLLVGCGEKDTKVETTTPIESTSEVESTTNEEPTSKVEEVTSEVESTTSEVETTTKVEEPTTTIEVPTTKVEAETTTKAPVKEEPTSPKVEPTTEAPTNAPEPPTTSPSVDSASLEKLKSFHIAYRPKESNMELDPDACLEQGGLVFRPGENYRVMADYVDSDCGDGTKPNPYTMHEWTERKYWGDRDEVTVGFYCYKEDIDNDCSSNGIIQTKAGEFRKFLEVYSSEIMDGKHKDDIEIYGPGIIDGRHIKIGTYEGRDIYFKYYFLKDLSEPGSL